MEEIPDAGGRTECLILGNGPSLLGRTWEEVPRERVFVIGLNQSWRATTDVDAHVSIDSDQFLMDGALPYYSALVKRRALYHLSQSPTIPSIVPGKMMTLEGGRAMHRHDLLGFSRHPFRKRYQGPEPLPPRSEDGGVALTCGNESRGSVAYIALQLAAALPFDQIWMVGFDMTDRKFEGAYGFDKYGANKKPVYSGAFSASEKHDRMWRHVPEDVKARVRVIEPSTTQQFRVVPWPWGGERRDC